MSKIDRETMSLLVECEDCKHKFTITSSEAINTLTHKKEFQINGQSIFLTYYDCPKCGRRHFVQIDDKKSIELLRACRKSFMHLAAKKTTGKSIPQKQSDKFKKTQKHLSEYRMELMKLYTGKTLHDVDTDADFVLRFSV